VRLFSTWKPASIDTKTSILTNVINSEQSIDRENAIEITKDEELQDHWKQLENRVIRRKLNSKGAVPEGRSEVRKSAWDAEEI